MKRQSYTLILLLVIALFWGDQATTATAVTANLHLAACTPSPPVTTIMPLGDSITKGVYGSGYPDTRPDAEIAGYRLPLYVSLRNSGYNVDFVGSQTAGSAFPGFDSNHQGHPGYRDDQIAGNIYDWLTLNPAEIILLHIGTNQLNTSAADVDNILDNIKQYQDDNPGTDMSVIVARIINRINYSGQTTLFNDNVETMIDGHPFKNNVVKVDMENGAGIIYDFTFNGGDMADNLHPYATGYEKMAHVWLNAIDGLGLTSCSLPPLIHATSTTAQVGQPLNHQVLASGNPAPTFSLTQKPDNTMTINPTTGIISWTPAAAGTFTVTVQATNSEGFDEKSFQIMVTEAFLLFLPAVIGN